MAPFLSLLGAAAVVAAPVAPGSAARTAHYQKVADGLTWKDPEQQRGPSIADQLPGHHFEIHVAIQDGFKRSTVKVVGGGAVRYSFEEHGEPRFVGRNDVLYRADYDSGSTGCAVVAFDLKAGKVLWTTTLKGLGPISHSKYRNHVWMERLDEAVLAVYGKESAGRYVELVDYKAGQTIGHKVFPRD